MSTETVGGLDAAEAGITEGLRRAAAIALRRLNVEETARTVVFSSLERRAGREQQPSSPQIEIFAEFVTLALAAGVTTEHVESWIVAGCGDIFGDFG